MKKYHENLQSMLDPSNPNAMAIVTYVISLSEYDFKSIEDYQDKILSFLTSDQHRNPRNFHFERKWSMDKINGHYKMFAAVIRHPPTVESKAAEPSLSPISPLVRWTHETVIWCDLVDFFNLNVCMISYGSTQLFTAGGFVHIYGPFSRSWFWNLNTICWVIVSKYYINVNYNEHYHLSRWSFKIISFSTSLYDYFI